MIPRFLAPEVWPTTVEIVRADECLQPVPPAAQQTDRPLKPAQRPADFLSDVPARTSRYAKTAHTCARPERGPVAVTQVTAVPVKVQDAVAPARCSTTYEPPSTFVVATRFQR